MDEAHNVLWQEWYENWKSRPTPRISYEEWLENRIVGGARLMDETVHRDNMPVWMKDLLAALGNAA